MAEYMSQIGIEGLKGIPNSIATASEDFAIIAEKIPTTYMILTAGFMDERGDYPLHHPKAQFDEMFVLLVRHVLHIVQVIGLEIIKIGLDNF